MSPGESGCQITLCSLWDMSQAAGLGSHVTRRLAGSFHSNSHLKQQHRGRQRAAPTPGAHSSPSKTDKCERAAKRQRGCFLWLSLPTFSRPSLLLPSAFPPHRPQVWHSPATARPNQATEASPNTPVSFVSNCLRPSVLAVFLLFHAMLFTTIPVCICARNPIFLGEEQYGTTTAWSLIQQGKERGGTAGAQGRTHSSNKTRKKDKWRRRLWKARF